jgi:hypothetical protein
LALLRLSTLYGILPNDLMNQLTPSQLNELMAYQQVWPSGEDAMDRRFEALSLGINARLENILYTVNRAAGGGMAKPQKMSIESFMIFNRGVRKKFFDEMSQEEINKTMRTAARSMGAKGV